MHDVDCLLLKWYYRCGISILGVAPEALGLTFFSLLFQVLQEIMATRRRDRTAPHPYDLVIGTL